MKRLVIANRGEIARRILRTARAMGFRAAVLVTQEDKGSLVSLEADAILEVSSYLSIRDIVNACKEWRAKYLHPGYGFLSESPDFARAVEQAGIVFVGPTPENMKQLGSKESAKKMAVSCDVPVLQALYSQDLDHLNPEDLPKILESKSIVSPFLVKASGGGGGRGMRIVEDIEDLPDAISRASQEALASFNDPTVFVERYIQNPRHIEAQIFGDGRGGGVFLGERECSLQRRHQKVIEEAPSAVVTEELRETLAKASLSLIKATKYRGAGTVEFLLDKNNHLFFLEMNTRLQVEHPVTECVYGVDLVASQLLLAQGKWPDALGNPNVFSIPSPNGVAFEARVLAEDPRNSFLPSPGKLEVYYEPSRDGVRVDSGVTLGGRISSSFDSLISKLIVHGKDRADATQKLAQALQHYVILPCTTNLPFLQACVRHPDFLASRISTSWIATEIESLNAPLLPTVLLDFFTSDAFLEALTDSFWQLSAQNHTFQLSQLHVSQFRKAPQFHVKALGRHKFEVSGPEVHLLLRKILCEENAFESYEYSKSKRRGALTDTESSIGFYAIKEPNSDILIHVMGEVLRCPNPELPWELRHNVQDRHANLEILAPMAGKIVEIRATEGKPTRKGQVLFVIESMKMQLEIKAPADALVKSIKVCLNQTLAGDLKLAELEKMV